MNCAFLNLTTVQWQLTDIHYSHCPSLSGLWDMDYSLPQSSVFLKIMGLLQKKWQVYFCLGVGFLGIHLMRVWLKAPWKWAHLRQCCLILPFSKVEEESFISDSIWKETDWLIKERRDAWKGLISVSKRQKTCFTEQRGTGLKCRFLFLVIFAWHALFLLPLSVSLGCNKDRLIFLKITSNRIEINNLISQIDRQLK